MRVSIIVVLSALTLAACGGGGGGTDSTGTTGTTGNGGGSGTAPQTLNVSPSTAHLDPGQIQSFSATGGQPPYTFSVTAGAGTVDASGHYTASGGAGSATVRVMDTAGATAQATISVNAPFVTPSLAASLDSGTQHTFTAMGGQAPYTFSVRSGGGTIDSATGIYTTPATAGSATVQIVDALGSTQLITVTIAPQLSVLPGSITVTAASGQSFVFAGQGGTPPYTYALASGPGSVAADGTYTAGSSSGASTVTVTDQLGTSVSAQVRSLRIRVNGPVWATVNDGTNWYLGGSFTATNPYSTPRMAILDATSGAPQLGCDLQSGFLDGGVNAFAVLGNSIYVGGSFLHYRGVIVNNLVKIDATTCALDTTFGQSGGVGGYGQVVNSILVSGQSLYVAGNFGQYRAASVASLVKIDAVTGALDTTFSPAAATGLGYINALAIGGTSLYVGGGSSLGATYLIKIDAKTGALDPAFGSGSIPDGQVLSLAVNGSSLYAGGSFAHLGTTRADVAKLDLATGVVDPTFASATIGYTDVATIAPSGTALYLGRGSGSAIPAHLSKIDATSGATDTTFTQIPSTDYGVAAIAVVGSSVYVGGSFTMYRNTPAYGLAKINATTGALDTVFTQSTGTNDQVLALALSGSTIYAGGAFSTYRGTPIAHVAKFDIATDQADPTFSMAAGPNSTVLALALAGSSLYLAGTFTAVSGQVVPSLAKIDTATGAVDTTFSQAFGLSGGYAQSLLPLNGALYVGGSFQNYRGVTTGPLIKINLTSGALDPTFTAGGTASGTIYALATAGSSLYLGGTFTTYAAQPAINLAKVDLTSGALDATFTQTTGAGTAGSQVSSLFVSGNTLYLGGLLPSYRGAAISGIAKIDATSGILDGTFSTHAALAGGNANAFALNGSSLYVGGEFATMGGLTAQSLAKVDATSGAADTLFTPTVGVCNAGSGTPECGGIVEALSLTGARLYVSAYAGTQYRGAPAYYFYPVDPTSGQALDP